MSLTTLTPNQVEAIAETARSWLDTPYAHLGRLKGHACDCVGLVIMVAQELGFTQFDTAEYGRDPQPERMRELLLDHLDEIPLSLDVAKQGAFPPELQAGDILHIRWRNHPRHLGIVLPRGGGGFNMIHAFSGAGRVVEHNLDKVWLSIIRSGFRYRWPL